MNWEPVDWLVFVLVAAGIGQLILCLASPAIPVVLGWKKSVEVLPKLLRQVFWTYGGPTLYFLLHGIGVRLERTTWPLWVRRLWVLLWVIGPLGLLFSDEFLGEVILKFLHVLPDLLIED